MRHGLRTQDFHRATTDDQKRWYGAGIPSDFWDAPAFDLNFEVIHDHHTGIISNIPSQQRAWSYLMGEFDPDPYSRNHFLVIGSNPSDMPSRSLSFEVLKKALNLGHRVHVNPFFGQDEPEQDETVFLLDGLWDDIDGYYVSKTRQWLINHMDCFCIMNVAGNLLKFIDKCGLTPDIVIQLASPRREVNMV